MNIIIREVETKKVKTVIVDPDRAARALKIFNRFSPHEAVTPNGTPVAL